MRIKTWLSVALLVGGLVVAKMPCARAGSAPLMNPIGSSAGNEDKAGTGAMRMSQAKPTAAPAPTGPQRIETIVYDAWRVTCQDSVGGATKKTCLAILQVASQDRRQVVLAWQIGLGADGRLQNAIRAPTGLAVSKENQVIAAGIQIQKGVEIKFGQGAARQLNYVSCDTQGCVAEGPMDDGFVKDASTNATGTVTVYASNGQAVPFTITVTGIDKAISSLRK